MKDIRKEQQKSLKADWKIVISGSPGVYRTIRSWFRGLAVYCDDLTIRFVCPEELKPRREDYDFLEERDVNIEEFGNLKEAVKGADFVLKKSGFGKGSSWAEGVSFLQEKSVVKAQELLHNAAEDSSSLYVIQEFKKADERRMFDEGGSSPLTEMAARIRITPYFSMVEKNYGQLIAVKATGCEKTNYIHASTGSINTAVV